MSSTDPAVTICHDFEISIDVAAYDVRTLLFAATTRKDAYQVLRLLGLVYLLRQFLKQALSLLAMLVL